MARSRQLVLFDFDYTLADSSRGIIECFNHALRSLSLSEAPADAIRALIGFSLPEMLMRLKGEEQAPRAQEFSDLYVGRADEVMTDLTETFTWVPDTLQRLGEEGFELGIVSTKFRYRIAETLVRDGLEKDFQVVVGGEDVGELKPSPDGLLAAMECAGRTPERTVYVGDSVVDGETAQRGNVPFIGVLTGGTRRDQLDRYPALAIVDTMADVPEVLRGERSLDCKAS